jgi:hypothetical protein
MEFGRDFSKWYIANAGRGVWHVFPPTLRAENGYVFDVFSALKVQQFNSGAQALAAFNRGYR